MCAWLQPFQRKTACLYHRNQTTKNCKCFDLRFPPRHSLRIPKMMSANIGNEHGAGAVAQGQPGLTKVSSEAMGSTAAEAHDSATGGPQKHFIGFRQEGAPSIRWGRRTLHTADLRCPQPQPPMAATAALTSSRIRTISSRLWTCCASKAPATASEWPAWRPSWRP